MQFKEWLQLNEARFKGFKRQFLQTHPDVPKYVANQLYQNKIGFGLHQQLYPSDPRLAPTTPYNLGSTPHPSPVNKMTLHGPSEIVGKIDALQGVRWLPEPLVVRVSPLDFDSRSQNIFLSWRFGFKPKNILVRQDAERFAVQNNLLSAQMDGDNEPIIMLLNGQQYTLIEGFHRTMLHLLNKGAPPDQVQALQSDNMNQLDFKLWRRVPIKAYVGIRQQQRAA